MLNLRRRIPWLKAWQDVSKAGSVGGFFRLVRRMARGTKTANRAAGLMLSSPQRIVKHQRGLIGTNLASRAGVRHGIFWANRIDRGDRKIGPTNQVESQEKLAIRSALVMMGTIAIGQGREDTV
jgi:hypothetical protein